MIFASSTGFHVGSRPIALNYFCFRDDDFNGKIIGTRIPHQKCSSHVLNRT